MSQSTAARLMAQEDLQLLQFGQQRCGESIAAMERRLEKLEEQVATATRELRKQQGGVDMEQLQSRLAQAEKTLAERLDLSFQVKTLEDRIGSMRSLDSIEESMKNFVPESALKAFKGELMEVRNSCSTKKQSQTLSEEARQARARLALECRRQFSNVLDQCTRLQSLTQETRQAVEEMNRSLSNCATKGDVIDLREEARQARSQLALELQGQIAELASRSAEQPEGGETEEAAEASAIPLTSWRQCSRGDQVRVLPADLAEGPTRASPASWTPACEAHCGLTAAVLKVDSTDDTLRLRFDSGQKLWLAVGSCVKVEGVRIELPEEDAESDEESEDDGEEDGEVEDGMPPLLPQGSVPTADAQVQGAEDVGSEEEDTPPVLPVSAATPEPHTVSIQAEAGRDRPSPAGGKGATRVYESNDACGRAQPSSAAGSSSVTGAQRDTGLKGKGKGKGAENRSKGPGYDKDYGKRARDEGKGWGKDGWVRDSNAGRRYAAERAAEAAWWSKGASGNQQPQAAPQRYSASSSSAAGPAIAQLEPQQSWSPPAASSYTGPPANVFGGGSFSPCNGSSSFASGSAGNGWCGPQDPRVCGSGPMLPRHSGPVGFGACPAAPGGPFGGFLAPGVGIGSQGGFFVPPGGSLGASMPSQAGFGGQGGVFGGQNPPPYTPGPPRAPGGFGGQVYFYCQGGLAPAGGGGGLGGAPGGNYGRGGFGGR